MLALANLTQKLISKYKVPILRSNFKCLLRTRAGWLISLVTVFPSCRNDLQMSMHNLINASVQKGQDVCPTIKRQSARNNHTTSQLDTRNKAQLRRGYECKSCTVHLPLNSWGWGKDSVFWWTAKVSHSSDWAVILSARLVQLNPQPKSCHRNEQYTNKHVSQQFNKT